jgi:diaminohydroxyphosphoribosylaminopyrimidine deaminase/5-amino-6-(5-phosphoribosylamino)uracil reductase
LLVVCGEQAATGLAAGKLRALGAEILCLPSPAGRLSLPALLEALASRQILSVLVEAGAKVNGAFLAGDLIQKVVLFYSETELGQGAIPFAEGVASPFLLEQRLRRISRTALGRDARITGYLHDPWQP